MKVIPLQLFISEIIGSVSAELISPQTPRAVLTVAHGAGAGMNHVFMKSLAEELATKNIATLRFNFPFTEHKKKRPDSPVVAHKTIEVALNKARELFPDINIYASGKSFGGRMSSQYLSTHSSDFVKGIIFFGFPLHPDKKPSVERAVHLKDIKLPMLFLQGTKDALAEWHLIEQVTNELPSATLIKIEGADHAFKKGKENLISNLAENVARWSDKLIGFQNSP